MEETHTQQQQWWLVRSGIHTPKDICRGNMTEPADLSAGVLPGLQADLSI